MVALVLVEWADQLEVVVAQQWAAGAVAGEVVVGPLAAVATLAAVVIVVVAEEGPPLVYHEQQHGNTYTVLDTKGLQTVQNFSFAAWSTSLCPYIFCFSSFSLPLSSWNAHQQCLSQRLHFPLNLPPRLKLEAGQQKFAAYRALDAQASMSESKSEFAQRCCPGGGGGRKDAEEEDDDVRTRCLWVTICAYVGVGEERSAGLVCSSYSEEDDEAIRRLREGGGKVLSAA